MSNATQTAERQATTKAEYEVRCPDCCKAVYRTNDIIESNEGKLCDDCRAETAKAVARIAAARARMVRP